MGIAHSHEVNTAILGPRQAVHKPCKSTAIPRLQRRHSESGETQCPLPAVCPEKIKLNGLAAGDTTTCCTTTCNSSLSGASASPETRSTGLGATANAAAIALSSGSPIERSDSAQAVSSIADQSPREFHAIEQVDYVEGNTKEAATKPSKWSRRTPRVQGLLKTLRRGTVRSRSQPPPSSSNHEHAGDPLAATSGNSSLAAALHAHILREEEEHRRRRHSSLPESYAEILVPQVEQRLFPPPEPFEDNKSCPSPAGIRSKVDTSSRSSPGANEATVSLRWKTVEGAETQEPQLSGQAVARKSCGRQAFEPPHRTSLGSSRWIADMPTNGRWEIERGAWNRQGVHLNHLDVEDERFRALAATRRLPPRQHAEHPQGWQGAVVKGPQVPLPQPRRVPIAPLAGRLQENQQRLLQSGQQVVPVTHRGVAAATTIELARNRHANEEKRRQQHRLIASPEPQNNTPAATDTYQKHEEVTWTAHKFSTGRGARVHDFSTGWEPASARNFVSDVQGAVSTEMSVSAHCFRQNAAAKDRYNGIGIPNGTASPTLPGNGGEAKTSRCSDPTSALPIPVFEQQREQGDRNALQHPHCTSAGKTPAKSDASPCLPFNSPLPFASRSLQRNAFVANPRNQVGAPKRRPR